MKTRYFITTWNSDLERFTPQKGVRAGPYSLWGLRKALRALRRVGYPARKGDPSVLVDSVEAHP